MAGLGSSPRLSSSAGDVERVVKTERDELRSSSIAMSSSPQQSPPPPAQTASHAPRPPPRAPAASNGAAENARQRTQEKDTSVEKGNSRLMSISELTEGPFTRFETQREIVLPLQEHGAREDSVRKDLSSRLLLLLLETHAWLASRPVQEQRNEIEKLEEEVEHFSEIEEQQGRSSSPVSAYSACSSRSTAMTSVFANYEPEIVNAEEHIVGVCRTLEVSQSGSIEKLEEEVEHFSEIEEQQERAREKLTQFVRHFTSAIQALAQGMSF